MALNIQNQPYGLTLPISHGNGGYFNQSYTIIDQIKSNLINLLLTRKGERRMNPLFGSTLYNVIFEFNSAELIPIIDSTIRSDIQTWMPYLRIKNIAVNIGDTNRDNYTVNIQIAFAVDQLGLTDAQLVDITLTKPII